MLKTESYKKGIILSTSLNIVAKLFVFLNTLVITYYFGTKHETDIFFYVTSVTTLICSAINGIDNWVLVPEMMRLREQSNEKHSRQFANFFLWLYIGIGFLLAFLIFISPISFYQTFSKFKVELLEKYRFALYFGIGIIGLQLVSSFLTTLLTSYKYFTAPIIANLINSVFTIVSTTLLHETMGIKASLLGVLCGYLINFTLLIYTLKSKLHWQFSDVTLLKDRLVWRNIGLMQLNIIPVWARSYITIFLLSAMATGTITAYNLAQNIAIVPEIFIATQLMAIAGIKFSELNAVQDFIGLKHLLTNVLTGLLIIMIPIAITSVICAKNIVSIIYLRGNFDNTSLEMTSFCLIYLAILMPFKIPDTLFSRLFTSMQLYKTTVIFGVIAHILFTSLTYFLTIKFALEGFLWSLIVGYGLIMPIVFALILHLKAPMLKNNVLLKNLLKLVVITALVSQFLYLVYPYMPNNIYINIIGTFLLTCTTFSIMSYFFLEIDFIKSFFQQLTLRSKAIKN